MKKITLIALLFAFSWQTHAQNFEDPNVKRNELKLDPLWLIFGSAINIHYDYFLSEWSSLGVYGLVYIGSKEDYTLKAQLLACYRLYFGKNPMQGFFFEGNFGLTSWREEVWRHNRYDEHFGLGIGIALGWKWYIPKSGVVLDIYGGSGRLFGSDSWNFYPRVGIAIGKRFGSTSRKITDVPSL